MTYRVEISRVYEETQRYRLTAPDGAVVADFHTEATSTHGINEMLRKLGERENFAIDLPRAPDTLPLAEDPSWR
jgi:hypothetical protein